MFTKTVSKSMNFSLDTTEQIAVRIAADKDRCLLRLPLDGHDIEARAAELLNRTGCRQWLDDGYFFVGYWSDLDGVELRRALEFVEQASDDSHCLVPLNHELIPEELQARLVPERSPGEPISAWLKRAQSTEA